MQAACGSHKGQSNAGGLYTGKITKIKGQNSIDGDKVLQAEALIIRERPLPIVL